MTTYCNNTTYIQLVSENREFQRELFKYSFSVRMLEYNVPIAMSINKIVTPIWILIGIFGNIVSALVWANPRMRTCNTAAYYLTCLAIADLTFLIIQVFSELQVPWLLGAWDLQGWCQIFNVANISLQYLCVFLVFAFTVERFLSVCHPFKSERFRNTRTPKVIIFLLILSLILGLPQAYFWNINFVNECGVRSSVNTMTSFNFYSVFTWSTELAIFGVVPLCVLVLNGAVVLKIKTVGKINLGKVKFKSRQGNQSSTHGEGERILVVNNANQGDYSPSYQTRSTVKEQLDLSKKISGPNNNNRGTTITLLWVSLFLIVTMLPNTVVYAMQHSVHFGSVACPIEDMKNDVSIPTTWVWSNDLTS